MRFIQFSRIVRKLSISECCFCTHTNSKYGLNLSVRGYPITAYVEAIRKEYQEVKTGGNDVNGSQQQERLTQLQATFDAIRHRNSIVENLAVLNELVQEGSNTAVELQEAARQEQLDYEKQLTAADSAVLQAVLDTVCDDVDEACTSIMLEVKTGVGGQEAMLFAKELLDMYCKYALFKGWRMEVADYQPTDLGGLHCGCVLLSGVHVYRCMRHEAGIHRVQRIPVTERSGRLHTSTASVVVLPQPNTADLPPLHADDIEVQVKHASGPGGQAVNKSMSAVRMVHRPTGISTECQVEASQMRNRKIALHKLTALVYQRHRAREQAQLDRVRRSQITTVERNEKIRTYNYPQDRITEHRLLHDGTVKNLKGFLMGTDLLDGFICRLEEDYRERMVLRRMGIAK